MTTSKHTGGCHCGAVRFRVELDAATGSVCNCTICTKTGWISHRVKRAAFKLLAGGAALSSYEWGSRSLRFTFCKHCGVQCFAPGDLWGGRDSLTINLRCLDDFDPGRIELSYWDGRHDNWYAGPRDTPWPVST